MTEDEARISWVIEPGGKGGRGSGRVPCGQRRLCQHSLQAARRLGFKDAGTLPGAFRHRQLGYVDALVMIQSLIEEPVR